MAKDQIVATVIMEDYDTRIVDKPKNLEVYDKNNMLYVSFVSCLQETDAYNRNRRMYLGDPLWESLNLPHLQELRSKNTWHGEAGHPMSDDTKRILTIDPKLTSHNVKKIWRQGNLIYGEVETLDDGMYGTKMTKSILQGMEPAFSLRALAQLVKKNDGSAIVKTRSHIVCYDWVILPSHDKAYRDTSTPIKRGTFGVTLENIQGVTNLGNGFEERVVPVSESSVLDFVLESSNNVKTMKNIAECCTENFTLTHDLKNIILKEGTQKYIIPVEEKVRFDVMDYLARR